MSVHYKFKSSLDYDTLTFDGLHISVGDLKKSIIQQKKIGKSSDFDLQITNAQTKEVYKEDDTLIPKNSSVIVARIPIAGVTKKTWDRGDGSQQTLGSKTNDASSEGATFDKLAKTADLTASNASEDDKIKAMMTQATQDYDPSKYMKIRGMTGPIPPNYLCYRCGKPGHWIKNCPTNTFEVKRSTGIPRSFMVTVEGPEVPGALLTNTGQFAVPVIDHEAYREGKKEKPPFAKEASPEKEEGPAIPDELLCTICRDLLSDAVLIPCCGNSYCDECVRQALLDSDEHECPTCQEKDISPDTLIPNRFLRTAVMNFKNETGYTKVKKVVRPPSPVIPPPAKPVESEPTPVPEPEPATSDDRPGTPVRDEKPEGGDESTFEPTLEPQIESEPTATATTSASTTNQSSGFTISTITTRIPRQPYPTVIAPLPSFRPNRPPRMSLHSFPEAPRGPPPPLRGAGMQQGPRPFSPKHDGPPHFHHHHHHHHSRHGYNPPMHPYGGAPPFPPPRSGPPHLPAHPLLPLQPLHMPHYASGQLAPPRGMPPRGPPIPGYSTQPPPPGSLPLGPPPFEQPPPPGIPLGPPQHGAGYDYYRDHKNMRDKGKNPFAEFERELMEYKDRSARDRSSRSSSRSYGQSRSSSRSRSPPLSRSMSRSSRSSSRSRSYSYSRSRSISMSRSRSRSRSRSPYRSRARSHSRSRRYSPHYRRSSRSPFGRPRSPLRREYSPGYYNMYRYQPLVTSSNFSPDQRGRFYQHSYRYDDYQHYNEHRFDAQDSQYNPRYDETYHEKRRSWTPDEKEKGRHDGRKSGRSAEPMRKEEEHLHVGKEKSMDRKRDQKRHRTKSKREKEHEGKGKDGKSRSQVATRSENVGKYERKNDEKETEAKTHKKGLESDVDGKKKHKKVKKTLETNKVKVKLEKTTTVEASSPTKETSKSLKEDESVGKTDPELKMKHVIKEADSTNVVADSTMEEAADEKKRRIKEEEETDRAETPEPDSAGEIGEGATNEDESENVEDEDDDEEAEEEEGNEDEEEGDVTGETEESVLTAQIPELSKWERDESDMDDAMTSPNADRKRQESPKTLPRDIVQRAEKAILLKPVKPTIVGAPTNDSRSQKSTERKGKSSKEDKDGITGSDGASRVKDKLEVDVEKEKSMKSDKFRLDRSKFQEKERLESPVKNKMRGGQFKKGSETEKSRKDDDGGENKRKTRKERDDNDEISSKKKSDDLETKKWNQKDEKSGEKRKSTIDESKFEPNYDETSDSDGEKSQKQEMRMKRDASKSPERGVKRTKTVDDDDKKPGEGELRRSASVSSSSSASPSSGSPHKRDKSHKHKKTKHKKHRKHKHKHKKKKSHKTVKSSDKH